MIVGQSLKPLLRLAGPPLAYLWPPKIIVQSQLVMEWIEPELIRVFCPAFADVFVRREASKGSQPLGEVVGGEESGEVVSKLIVAVVMVMADGGLFQRPVMRSTWPLVQRCFGFVDR